MYDLVIRGGTVYDGTGSAPFKADIAVKDGLIAEIGEIAGTGKEEIDAAGQIVTPGFVDVHTHYDGQVTWDPYLQPSTFHGVTTAVMGNCGVGFAPCRPDRHDWLIGLMEGVEDIPGTALVEGIKWNWESFPEYMDAVDASPLALDVGLQVPHGALRAYVMGERGARLEPATPEDTAEMARLVKEALEAGALGFSTSRTEKHRDKHGAHTPTYKAERDELHGIAKAMGESGKGVLQLIADFRDVDEEFAMLRGMVEISGRPMSMTIEQDDRYPDTWKNVLRNIEEAAEAGLPVKGQVPPRPTGVLLGLSSSLNPFLMHQTFREIWGAPLEKQVEALRDPAFRARLLAEEPDYPAGEIVTMLCTAYHKMYELGDPPNYEPSPEDSVGAMAERDGKPPREVLLDLMLKRDGHALLYFPLMNYTGGSLDDVYKMMTHKHTAFGLGDGGAHVGILCDASFPTTILTHWGRDRTRGPKLPLEWLINRQTQANAELVGLLDRGVLAPGMKADINVIDFDRLKLRAPEIVYDLPAGGKRLIQKAEGYTATIISGTLAFKNGEPTGALVGKLLRGARPRPQGAQIGAAAD
ncbi:amidohydrolase 3 [Tepidicaulis marinus]|uniref:Amidohydrolase 3 n=1 Tax=Tepidicaulis marinus TaxID=1333998 RepID=A0A081B9U8_9HYPH|nr:amidohydrolase family protein [Tepidicaulis marinus]GAK44816.1 amidohydrolase 3 [Tepidicaulis marinus]